MVLQNVSGYPKGESLLDHKASTEQIEQSLQNLIGIRPKMDTTNPVMSRSYMDRYDYPRLSEELPLVVIGMMSSEFSPNIGKFCDVLRTDKNKFTVRKLTFEPQLPGPVPTGATARHIRTSVSSATYENERVGLGFKVNYDTLHLPEGAQEFTNNVMFISGAIVKMAEFGFLQRLLETERNKLDPRSLAVMEYNNYQRHIVHRRDITAIAHKTSRGFYGALQKLRLDAEHFLGGGRRFDTGILPVDKAILFSTSQQNADYNLAGADATSNLHGFRRITTTNGITFYEPPALPSTKFNYSSMGLRMVNGAVHVYSRQPEYNDKNRSIGLFDGSMDAYMRITEEDMLAHVPFFSKFDATLNAWDFKVFFITIAFPVAQGCGLVEANEVNTYHNLMAYLRGSGGTRVVPNVDALYDKLVEVTKMPTVQARMRVGGYVQANLGAGNVAAAAVKDNYELDDGVLGSLVALLDNKGSVKVPVHGKSISYDIVKTQWDNHQHKFLAGRMRYEPAMNNIDAMGLSSFPVLRAKLATLFDVSDESTVPERRKFAKEMAARQAVFHSQNASVLVDFNGHDCSPVTLVSDLIDALAIEDDDKIMEVLHHAIIAIAVWQVKLDTETMNLLGFIQNTNANGDYYTHGFLNDNPARVSYASKNGNNASETTVCEGSYVIVSDTVNPSEVDIRLPDREFNDTMKLVSLGDFNDPRLFFQEFGVTRHADGLLPENNLDSKDWAQATCAIHLVKRMHRAIGDAMFPLLFRTGFNSSLKMNTHTLATWVNAMDREKLTEPVYILKMKDAMEKMDKGEKETFYTDKNRDFKPDVMVYTPETFHTKNSVALMRPCDTGTYSRVILMSPGPNVAAITLSPPVFTEGLDGGTQVGVFTTTVYYGAHVFNEDAVVVGNGMMYDTFTGGYSTRMHTLDSAIRFATDRQFRIMDMSDPSIWVVPMPKNMDTMPVSSFMHTTGRPPLDVTRNNPEEYPYADFWSRLYRFNTASPDIPGLNPMGNSVISMQLFPCGYEYTNTNGNIVRVDGNTCHGTKSEETGMQAIRNGGLWQYPKRMD